MTATPSRIDIEDVRAELRADDVINAYGLRVRRSGSKYRLAECPRCRASSGSHAIVINPDKGTWGHFGHGRAEGGSCYGDMLELVAACEGWDRRRDFAKLLEKAAKIAGVEARSLTDAERADRRVCREQQRAERDRQQQRDAEAALYGAKWRAAGEWYPLAREHLDGGERYVRGRGLHPRTLALRGHLRFTRAGDVAVPLFAFDGDLVNVVRRVIAPFSPGDKIRVLPGCPQRGSLLGRVQDIGPGVTVIVEGVMDALTAAQLWPDRLVLGASGAGQLHAVATEAAPLVRAAGGTLIIVPDGDEVGQRCAIRAGEAALAAGLVIDRDLLVLELPHHDLNESHCRGWKP